MAEEHQSGLNGGPISMSYNGNREEGSAIEDLMRKIGNSLTKQQILLQGCDEVNTYRIYGQEVSIVASTASGSTEQSAGSNKVRINPAVKHDWEQKYYLGDIVASHRNGIYIAYVLKVRNGGVVRIINRKTAQRALLKGFDGLVTDIAFAHIDEVLLACVDDLGTLHVHKVEEANGTTKTTSVVKILRPTGCPPTSQHRVIWCPYIPDPDNSDDEETNDDAGKLLVITHDNMAEMYNLETITATKPPNLTLVSIDIPDGFQVIPGHEKMITDAVFSPDGSALATACLDGEVRVFSVDINDDATPPKCLHKWKPHDGRPISLLVFLDNYKNPQQQFWKFAVTGANYNQEIKLWSCVSWTCLQTIRLFPPPDLTSSPLEPCLKAAVDSTADYLILSDINRKAMYVFSVEQDWEAGRAHVNSVSEFLLTSPCLSFTVLEAGRRKCRKTVEGNNLREYTTGEEDNDEETREEEETTVCTFIRMYAVHTKALQELQIMYEPESSDPPTESFSSVSQDEPGFRDALTDISVDTTSSDVEGGAGERGHAPVYSQKPLLLTPEAFSASPRKYADIESASVSTSSSTFTQVTPVRERGDESYRSPGNSTLIQSNDFSQSPGSQTPKQTQLTPSNIPLPPVTPGEDEKYQSFNDFSTEPSAFSSPRTGRSDLERSARSDKERSSGELGTAETVKAMFAAASGSGSGSSSRSGSIEVDHILNKERGPSTPDVVASPRAQYESPRGAPQVSPRGPYDSTIWPKAPDVAGEAKRLVTEALINSGADNEDIVVETPVTENSSQLVPEKDDKIEVVEISSSDDNDVPDVTRTSGDVTRTSGDVTRTSGDSEDAADFEQPARPHKPAPGAPYCDSDALSQLQVQMSRLTSMLTVQQQQLSDLCTEMSAQRQVLHHHHPAHTERRAGSPRDASYLERIDAQITDLSISIGRQVDSSLSRFSEEQKQILENQAIERTTTDRQRQDRLATTIASQVASATSSRVEKTMKQEIKTSVLPVVTKMVDPIKDQIRTDVAQKLTATDQLMRENISKMLNNKQTVDSIGQAAGAAVQGQIRAVYRETVQNLIMPSFDRACQEMYRQINDSFSKGTKEYQNQLETQAERLHKKLTTASSQLQQNTDSLPKVTQDLQFNLTQTIKQEMDARFKQLYDSLKETMTQHMNVIIRQEIEQALKQQHDTIQNSVIHAIRSSAATPLPTGPSPDPQQTQATIMHLLQQGQLNSAFQTALSASDLSLVMYVCETVNPQQLFSRDPCPLQQPVLLSLIQQLSADLNQNTELKHRFLQEAVMNLDVSNSVTKEHMPNVLNSLCTKLVEFIQNNPGHKMTKQMRMLLMASQSLR